MALVVSTSWLSFSLSQNIIDVLNAPGPSSARLLLFKNSVNPTITSVASDFQQCDFAGYPSGGIPLVPSGSPTFNSSIGAYVQSFNACTFLASGSMVGTQLIYGYYVVANGLTPLWWSERDPAAPFSISANGSYVVVPSFSRKAQ